MFLFRKALAPRPLLLGVASAAALLLATAPASAQQGWQFFGSATNPGYRTPAQAGYTYYGGGAPLYEPGYAPAAPAFAAPAYTYGYAAPSSAAQTAAYYGSDMADGRSAVVNMRVPANAVVRFGSEKTTQSGTERRFVSPPLNPGREYTYDVHVQWKEGDRTVDRNRTVEVRAGQRVNVDFNK